VPCPGPSNHGVQLTPLARRVGWARFMRSRLAVVRHPSDARQRRS